MPLSNFRDKQNFRTASEAPRGLVPQSSNLLTNSVEPTEESNGGNKNTFIIVAVAAIILFYLKNRKK